MTAAVHSIYSANAVLGDLRRHHRAYLFQIAPHPKRYRFGGTPASRIFAIRVLAHSGRPIGYVDHSNKLVLTRSSAHA